MTKKCQRITVRGIVQGVGFRPFVYRIAKKYKLKGWVGNTSQGVIVEIEGDKNSLHHFLTELKTSPPPAAKIDSLTVEKIKPKNYKDFLIKKSIALKKEFQPVSPDIATCADCQKELFNPQDRRYRYPFINCTNCGPRFTIIEDIPYDRPKTTMKKFKMCPECQKEYDNPANRRFHAQPNACPKCGPEVQLVKSVKKKDKVAADNSRQRRVCLGHDIEPIKGEKAIEKTIKLLKEGKIVAIKGLGGFHLACDALNEKAVKELRKRKLRRDKPFALMMPDLEMVKKYCFLSNEEAKLLLSPQRPIVLLRERKKSRLSPFLAPNQKYQGVMLPYTPIHHLLFQPPFLSPSPPAGKGRVRGQISVLVMTSGNLSEEPIAMENEEALKRLKNIADYFLLHNRDIYSRYDDSVTRIFNREPQILRRARSYAPYPIHLPFKVKEILATGPDLKNTFCLTKEKYAFISQHIGDMENLETLEHFENTLNLYRKLFRIEPKIIAYDLHPDYFSTKFALELATRYPLLSTIGIQHHHAHIASCMLENELPNSKVIGVAFDGTGYGTDGKIWGGEFLICDYQDFERVGHFSYIPLPGGDTAIKKPYRIAISYLHSLNEPLSKELTKGMKDEEITATLTQLKKGFNSPLTSSCGRLFDAVSALLGIRKEVNYDAQAAMELEMYAEEKEESFYPFKIDFSENKFILDQLSIFACVLEDLRGNHLKKGISKEIISARFHNTIAQVILELCKKILQNRSDCLTKRTVCLSGGVFQNLYLMKKVVPLLEKNNFSVYYQKKVPCNDGGLSLGQAIIANFNRERYQRLKR